MTARELAEEYCRNGIVISVDGIEGVIRRAIELCSRACETSYRTEVQRMSSLDGEAAAARARQWAAKCIRDLAGPVSREPGSSVT